MMVYFLSCHGNQFPLFQVWFTDTVTQYGRPEEAPGDDKEALKTDVIERPACYLHFTVQYFRMKLRCPLWFREIVSSLNL